MRATGFSLSNPYVLLALAAGLAVSHGAAFYAGWTVNDWHHAEKEVKRLKDERERLLANARTALNASENFQKLQVEKEVVYVEVEKRIKTYIDRPVYRNVCLDDDGVRDLNAIIDAANRRTPR